MLKIHRAERADGLVEALGDLVRDPLDDPMATEVVAVPTHGVERWLAQQLSARLGVGAGRADGVCANVDFPFPGRLVGGAVAAASGIDRDTDPWLPQRLVWPLLDVVDECLGEPWLAALAAHLGARGSGADAGRRARRFSTIRHIADLYDRYGVHRPEMLAAWASGDDTAGADTDGAGRPLPKDLQWQAELWRRLRNRVAHLSPPERLEGACERLRQDPAVSGLPPRVSLFGLTRLPATYLQVLAALGAHRDVHLFLLHPSPVLWEKVADTTRNRPRVVRRAKDVTARLPSNPLLASWGLDAREMQLALATNEGASADDHRSVTAPATTLLTRIQAAVRADETPPGVPFPGEVDTRPVLAPDDRSLQIHSCHGPGRQVEVVRDAILHLLTEDDSLEPRDIIVMCPDIEAFAPLIHATFGAGDFNHPDEDDADPTRRPPDLRVRLADRSLRRTNPVLGVVSELLDTASTRLTAAQVLDLAGRDPVRRRFWFDSEDLSRLQGWVRESGIRWGLDAAHREPFGLSWLEANTWHTGLDRMLLGVAAAEEGQRLVGGVLPLDDIASSDVDLAGRFAEFIDRLQASLENLAQAKTVDAWAGAIADAADTLTATSERGAWQRMQLKRILDEVVGEATGDGQVHEAELTLPEIRALLADRLRGRATRANFRTGHLTVCTLVPMRSVPHRVVCLLGLDDGVFPRKAARDGDDIILDDPHVGDRDTRSEDRQLLLDALLAATDSVVVTYAGRDERTNAERPPAVVVGELLDVVDHTVRTGLTAGDGTPVPARDRVVVHHPLQPFDVRNFTVGALVPEQAWSFDAVALDGARALSGDRAPTPPFLPGPLPEAASSVVALDKLIKFVQHPVKAFLRQRLRLSLGDWSEDLLNGLSIELDQLQQWGVGERLLQARLGGAETDASLAAEGARGFLPPAGFSTKILEGITPTVDQVFSEAAALVQAPADLGSLAVNVRLPGGRSLVGTVPGISGDLLLSVAYSRVAPKHRLAAWVQLLALTATHPDRPFAAATVGRARTGVWGANVTVARLAPLAGTPDERREVALAHLATLLDLYDRGMREPLPLYCLTSAAYAGATPPKRVQAARKVWESEWNRKREHEEAEHLLVLGGIRTFNQVLAVVPCDDEEGEGWDAGEPSRFGRYARRLWTGLLASEKLSDT